MGMACESSKGCGEFIDGLLGRRAIQNLRQFKPPKSSKSAKIRVNLYVPRDFSTTANLERRF
jgi:hypothetical protein